jgi:hypothetical protein
MIFQHLLFLAVKFYVPYGTQNPYYFNSTQYSAQPDVSIKC